MSKQAKFREEKILAALITGSICLLVITFLVLFEIIPPVPFSTEMRIKQEAGKSSKDQHYFTEDFITCVLSDEGSLEQTLSEGMQKNIDNMEDQLLPKSIINEFKQSKSTPSKHNITAEIETPGKAPNDAVGEKVIQGNNSFPEPVQNNSEN